MEETIDLTILNLLVKSLVTNPDGVEIKRTIDEKGVLLSVRVSPETPQDMGIVIGRSGIMANNIRTYMRALGKAHGMNIRVEFLEPDGSLKYTSEKPNAEIVAS